MSNVITNALSSRPMPKSLLSWLPVLASLAALYFPTYAYLTANTWTQDENAHGPLILAMSIYLAWQKRYVFAADFPARPSPLGWPLVVLGLLLFAVGRSQDVIILEVASHIPILAGILLVTRGPVALRLLGFPILFLAFMVPLPGFLVDGLTGQLKLHVSAVAEHLLYALGYPVARTGVTLSIGHYQLLVADACSGLYSMFSLTAVGLLYVHLMRHRVLPRNAALIACILPIAFAANCIRVVALSVITYHYGESAGQGLVHDLSSPMLFTMAILLMAGLDVLFGSFLPSRRFEPPKPRPATTPSVPLEGKRARPALLRHVGLALSLVAGIGLAHALTPRLKTADTGPKVDLETMIPKQFAGWRMDENVAPLRADPETSVMLDSLYNQILSRTYVDTQGRRVMLLIAYGGDQRESMQVHKPEVCYPSLGFKLAQEGEGTLDTGQGAIPVRRMVAVQGPRVEPVTYWMTIGDKIAQGGGGAWKLEQMKYGLTGRIPDGLLFRLSSITRDDVGAYRDQERFTKALVRSLPEKDRARFIGHPTL